MSIESVMLPNHLILCCPLLLLPSTFPSIRVFSNESALHIRWPKHWSFIFNISPSNEHPGLISFRMDWLDLLAVQGTLKSLLQQHSSKATILPCQSLGQMENWGEVTEVLLRSTHTKANQPEPNQTNPNQTKRQHRKGAEQIKSKREREDRSCPVLEPT